MKYTYIQNMFVKLKTPTIILKIKHFGEDFIATKTKSKALETILD